MLPLTAKDWSTKVSNKKCPSPYNVAPPVISCFKTPATPVNVVITTINHSYWSYSPTSSINNQQQKSHSLNHPTSSEFSPFSYGFKAIHRGPHIAQPIPEALGPWRKARAPVLPWRQGASMSISTEKNDGNRWKYIGHIMKYHEISWNIMKYRCLLFFFNFQITWTNGKVDGFTQKTS